MRTRVGLFEALELRTMLSGTPTSASSNDWQNPTNPLDVRFNGQVTPLDALAVINYLNSSAAQAQGAAGTVQAAGQPNSTAQSMALDVNGDGLITPLDALKIINALGGNDLAQVTLVATDFNGNPISSAVVGTTFEIEALVSDISGTATPMIGTVQGTGGVFAAYINATYNSTLASIDPNATVTYGSNYNEAPSSDLSTAGQIVGTGAFAGSFNPIGPGQVELWSIPVTATATGVETFTPSYGTNSGNEIDLYGSGTAVPASQVDFQPGSVTIVPAAQPLISIDPATIVRPTTGTANEVFTVTLTNASTTQPTTVNFSTEDGVPVPGPDYEDGNAVAGTDYTATAGTLTFAAGTSTAQITVPVIGSLAYNPSMTYTVNLSDPSANASIGTSQATGTITSTNAKPTLSIASPPAVTRPASGTVDDVFTVTLTGPTELYTAVNYATSNGTAIAGTDYTSTSGQLTIAAGSTTGTITVPVIGNTTTTGSVSFSLSLKTPTNATIQSGSGVATGSIIANVAAQAYSVDDVSVPEVFPASVTTTAVFTVSLGAPLAVQSTVAFATADGTATAASGSYVPTSGTLTFAAGVVTQYVTVTVNGDTAPQPATNFYLNLSNPTGGASILDGQGIATIAPPALTIDDVTETIATSGVTDFVFSVMLTGATPDQVTVGYATANQTAIAGTDYVPQSGNLTFTPGETVQTITVPVFGTTVYAPTKTFLVNLSSPTGGVDISRAQGIGTIDNPNVNGLSVADITVVQPASGQVNAVFTVTLPVANAQQVSVQYATADGTAQAPTDYESTSGTLTFPVGATSENVTVVVNGNAAAHPDQIFYLNLSNPVNSIIATSQATATIENSGSTANDEAEISLEVVDPTTLLPITTPLAAGQAFDVEAFVQDLRTTIPAADMGVAAAYLNVSYPAALATPTGSIVFSPNYTNVESGDLSTPGSFIEIGAFESFPGNQPPGVPPSEQLLFTVPMVASGSGVLQFSALPAQILPAHDVLLFGQNTAVPVDQVEYVNSNVVDVGQNSLSINNVSQLDTPTGTTFVFTVTRIVPNGAAATVQFSTANGTAIAGSDYTATSGTLTFPAGTTNQTQNITVQVLGSTEDRPNSTFLVNLTNPVGATIGTSPGIGTIQYNNPAPRATIANATAPEGSPEQFQVTLSQASGFPITISYATADGTATAGVNYTATTNVLTIPAGQTTGTITVPTIATLTQVGSLTFTLQLSSPTNVTLGNTTATGTITFVQPSGISGYVYVDSNGNGVKDPGELGIQGVTITVNSTATNASGNPVFTESTVTAANGSYGFIGLAPGTYNVIETQPGFFVTGAPTSHEYLGEVIQSGQSVTNVNFAQLGLRAQFVAAFSSRRTFLASTETTGFIGLPQGTQNMNLTQGDVWISFDNGWQNTREFQLLFNSAQGTATMTLYDNNLNVLATSTPNATGELLIGSATLGSAYFLKISGTNTDASLTITESVTADNASVAKSGSTIEPMVFTVVLSAPLSTPVTVVYATVDGTAVAGRDYTAETGTLTFAAGVTSQNVTVPVLASTLYGPSETFSLQLSNPTNAFVNPPGTGTGTILNNNPPPSMSIASTNVIDPGSGTVNAVFPVTLSAPSGFPTTVTYATARGDPAGERSCGHKRYPHVPRGHGDGIRHGGGQSGQFSFGI